MDPFERTRPDEAGEDGPAPSSLSVQHGLSSSPAASSAATLVSGLNALAATLVIAWHAPALITLYSHDWRPLAGAGLILTINAVGAKSRDIVLTIRNLRRPK